MTSDRIQRHIERLLTETDEALERGDWTEVERLSQDALALDPDNADAEQLLRAARERLAPPPPATTTPTVPMPPSASASGAPLGGHVTPPQSAGGGRYRIERLIGEGARKRVYLARDTTLDRDVALAFLKTEGLDEAGRVRIDREAQSMARLGVHENVVAVFDAGIEDGQPFFVQDYMGGGDLSATVGDGRQIPTERVIELASAIARGLRFIHNANIVHRDLKPGNVVLDDAGTPKIGDFGLAVAIDRTRLTQESAMLGTANYMAPEQALGGEVTLLADLYSLGAMLYEMVTGRPPFQGSDGTAVISQHISTPPVAPSWLADQCPADLEELILRLLVKDPADRPQSSTEVIEALERIDPNQHAPAGSGAHPLDRIARGVFVGRERELSRLRDAFDQSNAGRGGVALIAGAPGIGKTRLAEELETYARLRGAQSVWGRALETAGVPPYWPWVEAGRAFGEALAGADPSRLRTFVGSGGRELARVLPDITLVMPEIEPAPEDESPASQFRLFDAVATFFINASADGPLLMVLDDLHWADEATLQMLLHMAREMRRGRVLIVGTYREDEIDLAHPMTPILAALNREPNVIRLGLAGLDADDVSRYVRESSGVTASPELLDRLYEATEGNPFFVSEIVALMAEEGTLASAAAETRIPDSIREVLNARLRYLSEAAVEALTTAAVAGRSFGRDLLGRIQSGEATDLDSALEEGLNAQVIEEGSEPGRFRFSHALMRDTLLAQLSEARRNALHGEIGSALLGLHRESDEQPRDEELAYHFGASAAANPEHVEPAAHFSFLAGERAAMQSAWSDAARQFRACLEFLERVDDPAELDAADVHLAASRAERLQGDTRAAFRNGMSALSAYVERGDGLNAARAAITATAVDIAPDRRTPIIAQALEALNGADPALEARLLLQRAGSLQADPSDEARAAIKRASALADEHAIRGIRPFITFYHASIALLERRWDEGDALFLQAFKEAREEGMQEQAAIALRIRTLMMSHTGDYDAFRQAAVETAESLAAKQMDWDYPRMIVFQSWVAYARGDRAAAEEILRHLPSGQASVAWTRAEYALAAGRPAEAYQMLPEIERVDAVEQLARIGLEARIHFRAGRTEEARRVLDLWIAYAERTPPGAVRYLFLASIGEALSALADDEVVTAIYEELCGWPENRVAGWRSLDGYRAMLALHLGRHDEAREHVATGRAWAADQQAPVELGRMLVTDAALANEEGRALDGLHDLDRAAELFAQHDAGLYVEDVIRLKLELQGASASVDAGTSIEAVSSAWATSAGSACFVSTTS